MKAEQLALQLIELFQGLATWQAYGLIFGVLVACGFGLPIPEDITLITAGVLSSSGSISIAGALIAGFAGVLLGDSFLFFLGRKFGPRVFTWPGFRRIFTPERVISAETRIRKRGRFICFIARFMPGLRAAIFLTAGTMGVHPLIFIVSDGLAALISVPTWILAGHWFGTNLESLLKLARRVDSVLLIILLILLIVYLVFRRVRQRQHDQSPQI